MASVLNLASKMVKVIPEAQWRKLKARRWCPSPSETLLSSDQIYWVWCLSGVVDLAIKIQQCAGPVWDLNFVSLKMKLLIHKD